MTYEDEQIAMYCTCSFSEASKRRCEMHGFQPDPLDTCRSCDERGNDLAGANGDGFWYCPEHRTLDAFAERAAGGLL